MTYTKLISDNSSQPHPSRELMPYIHDKCIVTYKTPSSTSWPLAEKVGHLLSNALDKPVLIEQIRVHDPLYRTEQHMQSLFIQDTNPQCLPKYGLNTMYLHKTLTHISKYDLETTVFCSEPLSKYYTLQSYVHKIGLQQFLMGRYPAEKYRQDIEQLVSAFARPAYVQIAYCMFYLDKESTDRMTVTHMFTHPDHRKRRRLELTQFLMLSSFDNVSWVNYQALNCEGRGFCRKARNLKKFDETNNTGMVNKKMVSRFVADPKKFVKN